MNKRMGLLALLALLLGLCFGAQATEKVTIYLTDALGSPVVETDSQGNVTATAAYRPYGTQVMGTSANGPGFTGHVNDMDTGLVYMQARYYDPMGRLLSPDPASPRPGNILNFNRYSYVNDNPMTNIDPTGMNACGTNNDSTCHVKVTIKDRSRNAKGQYNDKFAQEKGSEKYNATATVTVNGKVAGTFLASSVPAGPGYATVKDGTYAGTLGAHDGHPAILINKGGAVPVVGGRDPLTGKSYATGIYVHIAGLPVPWAPLGGTGFTKNGHRPISAGCQLICSTQYGKFEQATGLIPSNGTQPQNHFTVNINTDENK